ncbi:hypothetical protein AB0K05_41150 [Nonomuraea sp. NPDC049486]|uniref:hypothetical protein n=1 Tax=Nonomuraea sp. NPDC049486 TaxID=3155773 RepID=UPI00341A4C5E
MDTRDAPDLWPAGFFISAVPCGEDVVLPIWQVKDDWESVRAIRRSPPASVAPHGSKPGRWLAEAGMDVTVPRRLIVEARLACWLQAYVDDARGRLFVGYAAASWQDKRHAIARLDVVHVQPGMPLEVGEALVRVAVREVAEVGALCVVTAIDGPELRGLGFRPANDGGLTLHTREC